MSDPGQAVSDFGQLAQTNCSKSELNRTTPPFRCITSSVLDCLKANNSGGGGSLEYRGGTRGEIVVKSNVAGAVALLGFQLDESSQTLNLNIKRKNPALSEQVLWDGFRNTISQCRQRRR
ncbi:MAG: hypothetical protein NW224_22210 [Leptolyngbyaceae cyanobacterium bins.302]|nr:hypothetical protein [Leptolyngbyaceae cyanobacterium bins.302]